MEFINLGGMLKHTWELFLLPIVSLSCAVLGPVIYKLELNLKVTTFHLVLVSQKINRLVCGREGTE